VGGEKKIDKMQDRLKNTIIEGVKKMYVNKSSVVNTFYNAF